MTEADSRRALEMAMEVRATLNAHLAQCNASSKELREAISDMRGDLRQAMIWLVGGMAGLIVTLGGAMLRHAGIL